MSGSSSEAYYKEPNSSAAFNNPRFVAVIVNQIGQKIGRRLSSSEIGMVVNFVRKLNYDMLIRLPKDKIIEGITSTIISRFASYECVKEPDNMHEFLKNQIGVSGETDYVLPSADYNTPNKTAQEERREAQVEHDGGSNMVEIIKIMGFSKSSQIQRILNPNALLRTNYILMDTRYRVLDTDGKKYFQWNHINNVTRAQGSVNTVGTIRDIVAMRVYPFRIPYTASLDTVYKKVSMLMREFQAQSFVAHEGRRFHFMFDVIIDGDSIYLRPENNNDAYYRFYQPITQIDTISIDFGSPLEEVVFDNDRSLGFVSVYWDGIQTIVTTQTNHNLLTGNNVYITGFTSLDNFATPGVTGAMNQVVGHNVIVTSPTTFKIFVDSSSMLPLIQGGGVVTLNNSHVQNVTVSNTLVSGDRVLVTDGPTPPFATEYGVFLVKFYDPVTQEIHLDIDTALTITPVWVFKDFRPPPLTRNDGFAVVKPSGGVTLTGNVVTATGSSFLSDFKIGDTVNFINVAASVDEGPFTVVAISGDLQMTVSRLAPGTLTGLTGLKKIIIQNNLFQVYYGGKRIFVPIELTYMSPES